MEKENKSRMRGMCVRTAICVHVCMDNLWIYVFMCAFLFAQVFVLHVRVLIMSVRQQSLEKMPAALYISSSCSRVRQRKDRQTDKECEGEKKGECMIRVTVTCQ